MDRRSFWTYWRLWICCAKFVASVLDLSSFKANRLPALIADDNEHCKLNLLLWNTLFRNLRILLLLSACKVVGRNYIIRKPLFGHSRLKPLFGFSSLCVLYMLEEVFLVPWTILNRGSFWSPPKLINTICLKVMACGGICWQSSYQLLGLMTMLIDYNSFYYMFSLNDYRNSFLCSSFLADLYLCIFQVRWTLCPLESLKKRKEF